MNSRFLIAIAFGLMACRHDPWVLSSAPEDQLETPQYQSPSCTAFLAELDAMTSKELKVENDRVQKTLSDKKSDDYPRASLIAGVYQAKNKNYARAVELLSPISNRKTLDEPCRLSLRLYTDLLSDLGQLEKDLTAERKQKVELERKLKALSDIEKEISQRDNKGQGL